MKVRVCFAAILLLASLPNIAKAQTLEECRVPDSKWSQVSLGFPVRQERLLHIKSPKILVLPFHTKDDPTFIFGETERNLFATSVNDIFKLSSGKSKIEFVFNPTISLSLTTAELDQFKIRARETYLKDFSNDQFGLALKIIQENDTEIDYSGIDSVVLYGISKKTNQEIGSALQYTNDSNFVGNNAKREDGKPWFTPIETNEKAIANVVLMYNNPSSDTLTHELLHNYGLQDLYGSETTPKRLSRMADGGGASNLLNYEKFVLGWFPETQIACYGIQQSSDIRFFDLELSNNDQLILFKQPNEKVYILESQTTSSGKIASFYLLENDKRPPITYFSYASDSSAGVGLKDIDSVGNIYSGPELSMLIYEILEEFARVYVFPTSLSNSVEIRKLVFESQSKVEAALRAKKEAEAIAAAELKAKREEAITKNTFYLDPSSCHSSPVRAELQIMKEESWESLVSVLGWDIGEKCPSYHPYKPWTIVETEPDSQLRWVFWPNGTETPGSVFKSLLSTKAAAELKAKQEAEAKAAAEKVAAELKAKQEAEAKAAAELKAKQEAEAKAAAEKVAAELKAKQEAEAKAAAEKVAAELKAKQEAEAKAAAELKAKQEAEAKAAAEKVAAELKAKQEAEAAAKVAVVKKKTITCFKGKTVKKVKAVNPKCPKGYKKK